MTDTAAPAASVFVPAGAPVTAGRPPDTRRRALVIALACVAATFLARLLFIMVFGSSLPFWDQWGAEGAMLYLPQVDGRYDWRLLGVPHNEHRIALTRLVAMGLFAANDYQWDVRVQLVANAAIFSAAIGVLVYYLQRHLPRPRAMVLSGLALLIGVLPFAWENTIAGFQNGFYFLFLTTVLMLWVAAHRRASPGTFLLLAALSVLTLYTIATGVLTLLACFCVLVLRVAGRENSLRGALPLFLVVVGAIVYAVATFVRMPYHDVLAAQGIVEHLRAIAITTSWPLLPPATLLFAAPFLLFLWRFLRERRYEPVDGFFAGLFVWAALGCLATAHSRGHQLTLVPSRYADLFALGSLAYAYFALRLSGDWPRWPRLGRLVAVATPPLIAVGYLAQSVLFWPHMQERRFLTRIEAINTRAFLEGDTTALENKPPFYVPVPDGRALAASFNNLVFRGIVPASIAPPGDVPIVPPRRCGWQPSADTTLPLRGDIACPGGAQAVELGRLSSWTFRLWRALYVDTFPALRAAGAAAPALEGICAIDAVNREGAQGPQTFRVHYPSVMRFSGWNGQPGAGRSTPQSLLLQSATGEVYTTRGKGRVERPDVVAAHQNPGLHWSGFDLAVTGDALPAGRYRLFIGTTPQHYCDSGHFVEVARPGDERLNY